VTADVRFGGANRPKLANSKVSQKQSEERFWGSLPDLLGQQPACIADLRGKRHSLPQPPLVAGICGFQGKQQILEPLKQFACRRIVKANVCRIVGE
jgi:hypothetical protein